MKLSLAYLLLQAAAGVTARPQPLAPTVSYRRDQTLRIRSSDSVSSALSTPFTPLLTGQWPLLETYNLSSWQPTDNWLGLTTDRSNPYRSAPYTGTTRRYDFTISRAKLAPDGVEKEMILVNGQFPGPIIKANWGDWIQVTVHNQITGPEEGTAMHWHGFLQSTSQWSDGVPGTSECPIPPGQSRTYTFQAQLYGTSWYHSHYSAQYAAGTWGPLIINGPTQGRYDEDLGPVMLSDYYYKDYFQILEGVMGTDLTKARPASDNTLINGRGCSAQNTNATIVANTTGAPCTSLARFPVKKGKKYRLRLINTSGAAIHKFSIDGHNMSVIAYDYVPIRPYTTNIVTLGVAQRADVVIEATGDQNQAYWIRTHLSDGQCTEPSNQPNGWAILQYSSASSRPTPRSIDSTPDTTDPCANDDLSLTKPMYAMDVSSPSQTFNFDVNFTVNATGHLVWLLNNQSYQANFDDPALLLAKQGNTSWPDDPQWNAVKITPRSGSVRVILRNLTPTSHPMHLHGHNMYILAAGNGVWDGTTIDLKNPMRRDVQLLPANGHLVIQWDLDNPGIWPLHCHIVWHVSAGLSINMIERASEIPGLAVPQSKFDECVAWRKYSQDHFVDQIDSGV